MHLKNFSLIRLSDGHYELSPAYDLVPVNIILPEDTEELALTLNGKKNRLKRTDFDSFGKSLKLTARQASKAIIRIIDAVEKNLAPALACSFLPGEMKVAVRELFSARCARLRG